MIYTIFTLDNFYLSEEFFKSETPSRQAGVSLETEETLRCLGCELVQKTGVLLKLYVPPVLCVLAGAKGDSLSPCKRAGCAALALPGPRLSLVPNLQAASSYGNGTSALPPFLL